MRPGICAMTSVLLMAMSIVSSAAAQTVAGRVLDRQSKRPLGDVTVVLLADTGNLAHAAARAATDSSGTFYLDAPSPGVYELVFTTTTGTLLSSHLALEQGEVAQREFLLDTHVPERAYTAFEVMRQVRPSPHNRPPRYPETMRNGNIQGEVLVQFVVDTTGKPEMSTLKVLRSSHPDFLMAVKSVLPSYEFEPAILMNRKVPQIVQMPFEFCFNGGVSPFIRPDTGRLWAAPPPSAGVCP